MSEIDPATKAASNATEAADAAGAAGRPDGEPMAERRSGRVVMRRGIAQRTGRLHLVRAWLDRDGEPTVRPLGAHAAGSLGSLAGANAWMVVGPDVERLEEGTVVETWPMLPS